MRPTQYGKGEEGSMRRLLTILGGVVIALAAASSATADPVRHFDSFVIDCGPYGIAEIVSKPGTSQVVQLDGAPSNSIALLVDYEFFFDGEFIDFTPGAQYQPPGVKNNQELVECYDTSVVAPDYFKAWVLFTPVGPKRVS